MIGRHRTENWHRFSCERWATIASDWGSGKRRLHWDYDANAWRSGKLGRIVTCMVCDQPFIGLVQHKMCDTCTRVVREAKVDYEREKNAAIREVAKAVRNGDLLHPSAYNCADCGVESDCYDHRDYRKPLDVVAVCRGCNRKRGASHTFPEHLKLRGKKADFVAHPDLKALVSQRLAEIAAGSRWRDREWEEEEEGDEE